MNVLLFFVYLFLMAGVTYLIRMLPFTFFKKKIKSRYLRSFLYYVPYTVLAVMTFPAIFYSVDSIPCAIVGTVVGVLLALLGQKLLVVAAGSALAVFLADVLLKYIGAL